MSDDFVNHSLQHRLILHVLASLYTQAYHENTGITSLNVDLQQIVLPHTGDHLKTSRSGHQHAKDPYLFKINRQQTTRTAHYLFISDLLRILKPSQKLSLSSLQSCMLNDNNKQFHRFCLFV